MKTPPTNLSHEELERWHYANGDTVLAAVHGDAAEFSAEAECLGDKVFDLEAELTELRNLA